MTNAALVAAGATSGAGVLGFVIVKFKTVLRRRRKAATAEPKSMNGNQ
jgi:hypothetical protein